MEPLVDARRGKERRVQGRLALLGNDRSTRSKPSGKSRSDMRRSPACLTPGLLQRPRQQCRTSRPGHRGATRDRVGDQPFRGRPRSRDGGSMSRADHQAAKLAKLLGLPQDWVRRRVAAGITDPRYLREAHGQQFGPEARKRQAAAITARAATLDAHAARRSRQSAPAAAARRGANSAATCRHCGFVFAPTHGQPPATAAPTQAPKRRNDRSDTTAAPTPVAAPTT